MGKLQTGLILFHFEITFCKVVLAIFSFSAVTVETISRLCEERPACGLPIHRMIIVHSKLNFYKYCSWAVRL